MSSSSQDSLTRKSARISESLELEQNTIHDKVWWLNETITIKFWGEWETFYTAKSKSFKVSENTSIQLFQFEHDPNIIRYAKTKEDFIKKLTVVATDLGFSLTFGKVKGDGNCLYRSLAPQLDLLPPRSFMEVKRKVLENLFADETLLSSMKFDSGDGENFLDLVKFLEVLWEECRTKRTLPQSDHLITVAGGPLAIVSEALEEPSKKPKNPFRLLKAVIACVFGNKQPAMTQFVNLMTNVCIHIIYLYPCQMLALTNLLSFSFFFKAIDEYSTFSLAGLTPEAALEVQAKRATSEATITNSLRALRQVEKQILRNCLREKQRQDFLQRIEFIDDLSTIVSDCVINLPDNANLLAPLVKEWNELINSIGIRIDGTSFTPVNPAFVIKTLESLRRCFALCTETKVLLLLNLRSSNYSGELHIIAAARAYNRPIHVYSNHVINGGLPLIYGGEDTDAAGNFFVVSFS